jgi:membrane-bound lytic murein transglycosylase D
MRAGVTSGPDRWPIWATSGASATVDQSGVNGGAPDTLNAEADRLIDSLAVPIDSIAALPSVENEVPDISDSLAALTQARLPSMEELFDYPVVVNRRVLSYVDFFLGRSRNLFEGSLRRSGRYLPMARRIFQEEGIPQDLVFLAHVESAFKYNARSRARALGLWQFIRGTASLYGLRCDSYVDERLDPERETRACARYLHNLYDKFGDWHLALAAYNTGAGNVDKAIARAGTRDFWRLAETRHLMRETRDFVPAILAATILAKSPGAYGLTEETEPPLAYDTVALSMPSDLRVVARCCGATQTEIQRLNPALLVLQTPPRAGDYEVRVPPGLGERLAREISRIPPEDRLVVERHAVRRGDTLGLIARRYGTTVRAIQDANRLGRSTTIHVGQALVIPNGHATPAPLAEARRGERDVVSHRVARGETLGRIAAQHGVSVQAIQAANRLSTPDRISVGQSLVIPIPAGRRDAPDEPVAETAPLAPSPPETSRVDTGRPLLARVSGCLPQDPKCDLGRGPSTAHLVAQARQQILMTIPSIAPEPPSSVSSPGDATFSTGNAAAARAATSFHIVRRGDTLGRLAEHYGASIAQLLRWNRLRSGRLIYPGQKIRVASPAGPHVAPEIVADPEPPAPETAAPSARNVHVVRRGDSLWRIAQRYGVGLTDLLAWNGLRRASRIYPGQKLFVHH